jgi:hypothetical protein
MRLLRQLFLPCLLAQQPELAKRLRTKLEAWAAELQPPGINLRPTAKTCEEYYDFYLDGKVTLAEFLNGRTGPTVPALEQRFKNYDVDGDGVWTRSELQSASKPKGNSRKV